MCRRKGDTYRKWNTKKNIRVRCPGWTIRSDVLEMIKDASEKIEINQSRIVEEAIKQFLNDTPKQHTKLINAEKIFSKT